MNLDRGILCVHAELTLGLLFVAATFLIAGCGGGSVASPVSSTPTPVTPTTANVQGQWQVIAQSTNGGTGVLIETNLAQSGTNVTAVKSSVVLIQGVPGTYTGLGGECDNGALGDDSIQATVSGQTLSFTMTEAGSLGTGTSTGTATISSDGTQITSGTYTTAAACGFQMDNGTLTGAVIKPFSGTFAGMLANGSTTDAVTVTISQSGYNLSVAGTDNGTPFTLSGTVVGATFNVTGTIAGQSVQYVGLYETSANDFRVYDTSFNPLGVLNAQSSAPPPTPIAVSVSPSTASVQAAQQTNFVATVMNDSSNKGVTWALSGTGCSGATCGTVSVSSSASGVPITYTAPSSVPTPASVMLTATSVANGSKTSSAVITVTAAPQVIAITLSQTTASATVGSTASFTATVANDPANKGVTWALSGASCSGAACGTVAPASASGAAVTYTAPANVPTPPTVTLTATSVSDPTKSATATITITAAPAIIVSVSPMTASIVTGGATSSFTATVTNDSQNKGVTWTLSGANCSGAGCGTVSPASTASGAAVTYTSPAKASSAGTVTLTATSVSNNSESAAATITLAAPPAPTPSTPLVLGHAAVPAGYGEPVIATDAGGNVNVAWVDSSGPGFVRSTNGGVTFSATLVIPSDLSLTFNAQNGIQIGLDEAGHINLLWHRDLTPSSIIPNSFFSHSTDGGMTFSTPVNPGGATSAQLVVAPNGNVTIIWFDQTTSNLLAVSSTDGVNFSSPTTVWTANGNPMDLTVATGSQGQIYLFWTQVVTMTNCSILFSSSANGITFTPAATISSGAGSCNQTPSAFVDSAGGIILAWDADGASVFFSHSTSSGATFSVPMSIPTAAKPMTPQVTVSPGGTIYIVWQTGTGESFARSVDGGATFSPTPPTFVLGQFAVADSCDNVTVMSTGTSRVSVMYQRSTDGGATFAAPVTISDLNFNYEIQITIDKSGNVHTIWGVDGPPDIEYVRLPSTCHVQ
jgi:hypothetical protein